MSYENDNDNVEYPYYNDDFDDSDDDFEDFDE